MPLALTPLQSALQAFATNSATQGQEHIRPFHGYLATRLVVEGGFLPDEITPHPPIVATRRSGKWMLEYDAAAEMSGELTVFGGMKTKKIDVVVAKQAIGPVVAISVKGTIKAYRNLVNRMEEAIGDSTNLHVMYPGLVYGFLHLMRANRQQSGYGPEDMGLTKEGAVSPIIARFSSALCEMTGRRFVRNDFTRYEAVALALIQNDGPAVGSVFAGFPPADSPLRIESFFRRLYEVYDLRFPFRGETVRGAFRETWSADSPLFQERGADGEPFWEQQFGYRPRLAEGLRRQAGAFTDVGEQ